MAQVDIVIPLYNKAQCVARAVGSIQQQTMTDWRLIVVDDGSTDEGPDIVRRIDDDRIEIITQTNQGPGAARNAGIARATSGYLAFLDADDEWYPDYLANSLKTIQQEDVALVATMYEETPRNRDMARYWADLKITPGKYSLQGNEDPGWADSLLRFPLAWNSLIRTEVARKYDGFYDKNHCCYAEDTAFFLRVGINEEFVIIDFVGACHHREDSSLAARGAHPLQPFLAEPEVVLRYCPPEKRGLMQGILDAIALRTARNWTRAGAKAQAAELLKRFPGAKSFRAQYYRFLYTRFKCTVGPPSRSFLRSLAKRLQLKNRDD